MDIEGNFEVGEDEEGEAAAGVMIAETVDASLIENIEIGEMTGPPLESHFVKKEVEIAIGGTENLFVVGERLLHKAVDALRSMVHATHETRLHLQT